MALTGKQEDLVHVPWSSTEEWLGVYKKIYSGDIAEQNAAHEILLVWKARISKLPVGVECTLGLLQVCLRDREWTPKIRNGEMSISYENDLRMMYSTVIMKFLNHISNIAHNKQTSLFVIAKQLNIPDWIVDLRHDTAHGHELPSIDVMRIVANILLTWLHEEYWAAEAKNLQTQEVVDLEDFESEFEDKLINLIEMWTAVGLYVKIKHIRVSDLPDPEMRKTLKNFLHELNKRSSNNSNRKMTAINDQTELSSVLNILLVELSKYLNKDCTHSKNGKTLIDSIINNEAFLTNPEILSIFVTKDSSDVDQNCLPQGLVEFWKDILLLLQEKKLLLPLFLELIEFIKKEKDQSRKLLASMWVKALAKSFNKLKISKSIYQKLEQKFDQEENLSSKALVARIHEEVDKRYPDLKSVFTLNVNGDFPNCLTEKSFVKKLILRCGDFSQHYVPEILNISSYLSDNLQARDKMLELLHVKSNFNKEKIDTKHTDVGGKIYTIEDLQKIEQPKNRRQNARRSVKLFDSKIRNNNWHSAEGDWDWSTCPIGALPWQIGDFQPIEPLTVRQSDIRYAVVKDVSLPKIIDSQRLRLHSKIQWENLVKKKKLTKKKQRSNDEITVVGRVVNSVKNMQEQS